jgi:hypothetical protein
MVLGWNRSSNPQKMNLASASGSTAKPFPVAQMLVFALTWWKFLGYE